MNASEPVNSQAADNSEHVALKTPWPHGVSHQANMRISDVMAHLKAEFPAVTLSKLRFLEDQGLIEPVRTSAGYRQYSQADVERLRFVLTEQRDRYLPLKIIKEKLAALDRGLASSDQPLIPRIITRDGASQSDNNRLVTYAHLARSLGVSQSFIDEVIDAGLIDDANNGLFDETDQSIVKLAAELAVFGIEPRHLRAVRIAAQRQASLVEQASQTIRHNSKPGAKGQAEQTASELGEAFVKLHSAWLRKGIQDFS